MSLEEKLEQCVLSRGLAKRLKKKGKEEKQRNYSRKRKRHSFRYLSQRLIKIEQKTLHVSILNPSMTVIDFTSTL